jgi:hypothetical protein
MKTPFCEELYGRPSDEYANLGNGPIFLSSFRDRVGVVPSGVRERKQNLNSD